MKLQCNVCKESESRANLSSHEWCPIELKKKNAELMELQTPNSKQMIGKIIRDSEVNAQKNAKLTRTNKQLQKKIDELEAQALDRQKEREALVQGLEDASKDKE